jgi:coenzyme F420-dependent glucose-6-phosphate dehydrogenase
MLEFGLALSSEEHRPQDLIRFAAEAEDGGMDYAVISDHFHPWIEAQGQSPFAWTVLGGISQATRHLRIGTGVTCPIRRIHPAIIAQAAATTATLMPGRFWLGLGSGEALNEHITGEKWPRAATRLEMLEESIAIIRELWTGEETSVDGEYFQVETARIYTLPEELPPIYVAASGPKSARLAAQNDGFIGTTPDESVLGTFAECGGKNKPRYGQITVSWSASTTTARKRARTQWPIPVLPGSANADIARPALYDALLAGVDEEEVADKVVCGPDPADYFGAICSYIDAGYDHITFHQVGSDQQGFISFFNRELRPLFVAERKAREVAELKSKNSDLC